VNADASPEDARDARPRVSPAERLLMLLVAAAMVAATGFSWWPISWMEVAGFVTGFVCVWLAVREHVWTWPIGLANNVAFLVLFWHSRLYADASLQVVYFALGAYGWWNWLYGGRDRTELRLSRTTRPEWLALAALVPLSTWGLWEVLVAVSGAAPFWDSLTTVLSLAAQYLMCRKRVECWLVWIAVDLVYVPLYIDRKLYLTAGLYGVFLVMCVFGLREWVVRWRGRPAGMPA
jgi:nicotinamide mononucleotide transporter